MKKSTIAFALMMTAMCSYGQGNFTRTRFKPDYISMHYTTELGFNAGLTAFLGDLGGTRGKGENFSKDLNGVVFRPHIGISYSYYPQTYLKVGATFNYTTITGADSVIKSKYKQSYGRYIRNLSFRSRLEEVSAGFELYPLQLINRTHRETLLKPFVGAGVGMLHYNPKAQLDGKWVELQPLKLEGEGFDEYPDSKDYTLYQFYIPLTFGFKYRLDDNISIGFMATFRKTFSDYLDDVSHHEYIDPTLFGKYLSAEDAALAQRLYYRGDPTKPIKEGQLRSDNTNNDSYTTLAVTFAYNFGTRQERDERNAERVIRVKRSRPDRANSDARRNAREERKAIRRAQRVGDGRIKVRPYRSR